MNVVTASRGLLFIISVVFILLYSGVYCATLNFSWLDVNVYGQPNFTTNLPIVFNSPEDFIFTSRNTLLVAESSNTSKIIEVDRSGTIITIREFGSNFDAFLSLLETNQSFLVGTQGSLVEFDRAFNSSRTLLSSFDGLTGLGINRGLIFASDFGACRVFVFPLIENSTFTRAYGDSDYGNSPTATNFYGPRKVEFDCDKNGFWVTDSLNDRVLHFKINSTVADIVLGQQNFNSSAPNLFNSPAGVAYNYDCSVLFVADEYRVFRFRAPFRIGQSPEGTLGGNSSQAAEAPSQSTFSGIFAVHFDDYKNGQGRLYLLDRSNNRIISGVTSYGPLLNASGLYPLYCTYDSSSLSVCIIEGGVKLMDNQFLRFPQSKLSVLGDMVLYNNSRVELALPQNIITVSGTVYFAGALILTLSANQLNHLYSDDDYVLDVTIFEFNSSVGSFSNVTVTSANGTIGECISVVSARNEHSLKYTFMDDCDDDDSSSSDARQNMIIGIVVGVGGCLLLILGVATFMIIIAIYDRKNHTSGGTFGE